MNSSESPQVTLTDGSPVTPDHREIDQLTGQQRGYVVLSAEERAKGFVRPVRRSYVHVGIAGPTFPLRDLTEQEIETYGAHGHVKYEEYPEDRRPSLGRFWTQQELDAVGRGCGVETTMGQALAETYARQPDFYSGTFCAGCRVHRPVGADGEFVWSGTDERVGT